MGMLAQVSRTASPLSMPTAQAKPSPLSFGGPDPAGVRGDAVTQLSTSPTGQTATCLNPACSQGG